MDHVATYWLTHLAVMAQPRAYSRSTFTAQSPPYCASPLLLAAPGARTSGLHAAYFGTDFHVHCFMHFPAWAGAHFAVEQLELGSTSLFLIMFIRAIRAIHVRRPHRGLLKCYAHYMYAF